ncbi:hypothetical protein SAMN05444340_10168 [Citreimonas salinaria]|uniref:Transposase n=2 Tax=Citreimonas salinaria TaxID=321339 RepID=A0A1H3EY33_9RHOB|nr:hypothetical protein SAMN05444340_10168 [Citreimonas salinaria]
MSRRRLRELKDESVKLKKLLAEPMLYNAIVKDGCPGVAEVQQAPFGQQDDLVT